jgi:hypothetical protein
MYCVAAPGLELYMGLHLLSCTYTATSAHDMLGLHFVWFASWHGITERWLSKCATVQAE